MLFYVPRCRWQLLAGFLCWLLAFTASAQPTTAPAAAGLPYAGPRYPGGPDSLRAALQRLAHAPGLPTTGELFIQLVIDQAGRSRYHMSFFPPPGPQAVSLTSAQMEVLDEQLTRWPAWELNSDMLKKKLITFTLPLVFGPEPGSVALMYNDVSPAFATQSIGERGRKPVAIERMVGFFLRQVRYPAARLRDRTAGKVYAYFEVTETGAVEQRRIVGSLDADFDAEVLRVLALLPDALTPPLQAGRPVRVGYVLPVSFSAN